LLIDDNVDVGDVISYLGGALHPEFEIEVYILLAHIGIVDALATWLIELADGGREVHRLGVAKPLKLYESFEGGKALTAFVAETYVAAESELESIGRREGDFLKVGLDRIAADREILNVDAATELRHPAADACLYPIERESSSVEEERAFETAYRDR